MFGMLLAGQYTILQEYQDYLYNKLEKLDSNFNLILNSQVPIHEKAHLFEIKILRYSLVLISENDHL